MDKTIAVYPDNHEAEMCYGGEAARQENINGCTKNPGHKDFVPLKNFTINCLPSRYHDNDLMFETIKAMATLTIQVKTKFTSLERPEFYPSTQVPYPCYKDRGSHVMRLGTGRVCQIFKYTERDGICYCVDCQVSATPNKVYGVLGILTAKHVVFDDSEARQTTCVLGFDDDESHVTSLTGWTVEEADVEKDRCWLNYVTCDLDFIDELVTKWRHFEDLCREVNKLYGRFADVDKLTVIVSHPHGCPKQVSVGQWIEKHERDNFWTRYCYTSSTCPGSSGAPVYRLEYDGLVCQHIHSGSNSMGNCSGEYWD